MTKVEACYDLTAPLEESHLEAICRAHGIYGLSLVRLAPAMDELTVQYDASRMGPSDVDAALGRAGLCVRRREL